MEKKVLLTETELENVAGGDGYMYYRDNGSSYDVFICTVPLNQNEIDLLKSGGTPRIFRDGQKVRQNAFENISKGKEAETMANYLKEDYGHITCTAY